jgi:hypothetical protein
MSRVNRPEKSPVAVSLVDDCAAMVEDPALISIEVSGTKSLCRVGVPSQPQPDSSNNSKKTDLFQLAIDVL